MNRHLAAHIAQTTKVKKYDTRATVLHKALTKGATKQPVNMEEVIKLWEDTHDKFATLKKLGKIFKQINDSHEKDLISQ